MSSLLAFLPSDDPQVIAPTLLVIISALSVSHAILLPSSSLLVIERLVATIWSGRDLYSADVQDAVVVAIIRLVAEVDVLSKNVESLWIQNLRKLAQRTSSSRVRQVCARLNKKTAIS